MPPWAWVLAGAVVAVLVAVGTRRWADRAAARAVLRFRARLDRFKLTSRRYIRETLLADPAVLAAAAAHAAVHDEPIARTHARVRAYLDEIVPFFNILMYYEVGYAASRTLLDLFYRVTVEQSDPDALRRLPRDAIVVYLFNHRSNADYVLAGFALAGQVSISYAVGEWARVFPLEYLFKSFGSYFVRRRYREPLYHAVLERYVQLITRNGVTQGIFPEGGLSRDGRLQRGKIGLLDYVLGVGRDPAFAARMYLLPVALNYDRVLEDRSLLREAAARAGARPPRRLTAAGEVLAYLGWNVGRALTGRWRRYGRAAVTIGTPIPLAPWFATEDATGRRVLDLPREARLPQVQALCDEAMDAVGRLIPVTPVCLACAALQTFPSELVPRDALLARMEELRDELVEVNARVLRADRDIADTFDRAYRMLRMRRVVARQGDGFVVLPRGRELISYYANAIAHLLGPWERAVRARDALPADALFPA